MTVVHMKRSESKRKTFEREDSILENTCFGEIALRWKKRIAGGYWNPFPAKLEADVAVKTAVKL